MRSLALAFAVFCCCLSSSLCAAEASLSGVVTDQNGAALRDVAVKIKNVDTGATHTIATDGAGRYHASGLPAGLFEIQAAKQGSGMYRSRESPWRLARTPRSTLRCSGAVPTLARAATSSPPQIAR